MSVSNYDYPEDEFDVGDDDGPVPVGVHRAQVPRWRSWAPLLAIIIIVPALAWGAVTLFLNSSGGSGSSDAVSSTQPAQGGQGGQAADKQAADKKGAAASAKPSASASASGNVDFNTKVTVSNGTYTDGLAKGASEKLTNGGFTSVEVIAGVYENAEPAASTVYFSSPEARPAAEEVGKRLGISNVAEGTEESTQGAPIAVILRDDYKPQ
ncbi:LytR C-terminal domain-containing protein [Actinomyces stomatis]|uniref:LytR C-terminal domain-containing protein n=1 Tax=Actinomyces stomatis TaxID=3050227 RepID=UPI0028526475|nr:LytR C-terminal domain-containing protein [Actinomyces sp. PK606]